MMTAGSMQEPFINGSGRDIGRLHEKCTFWLRQIDQRKASPEDFRIWFEERVPELIEEIRVLRQYWEKLDRIECFLEKLTPVLEERGRTSMRENLSNVEANCGESWPRVQPEFTGPVKRQRKDCDNKERSPKRHKIEKASNNPTDLYGQERSLENKLHLQLRPKRFAEADDREPKKRHKGDSAVG